MPARTGVGDTSKRGFASMDANKQREIASKGGKAAHAKGTAHEFTPAEAREAGRKGGEASRRGRDSRDPSSRSPSGSGQGTSSAQRPAQGSESQKMK